MSETFEEYELTVSDDNTAMAQQPVCDVETVKLAQSGDKDAFTQLFMQTYSAMYFTAKQTLSNDEDIYDALQIGYTKAYKYISRLSSPEKFYPWLHTIIKNAALDVLRDVLAHASGELTDIADDADADADADAERRADLRRILACMDEGRAQVLTLHYYDGLSLAEIARMLGQPASTVRSRLRAAKNELYELLRQSNIDENLYGGSLSAMIVTSLRALIGTDILSAVVAQDMLDNILEGKNGRLEQAAYKIIERDRNRRVRNLAAILLAICIGVAALTTAGVFALIQQYSKPKPPTTPSGVIAVSHTSGTVTTSRHTSVATTTRRSTTTERSTRKSSTKSTSSVRKTTASTPASTTITTTTTAEVDTFVSDYRAGHANTVGNTPNNIAHTYGVIAKQDEWLYYYDSGYLSKIKTDASEYQLLAELPAGCMYINVVGDWIYYNSNGVRRMRTDGSEQTVISTGYCRFLYVSEGVGYYIPRYGNTLYRFDTDDLKPQKYFTSIEGQVAIYNDLLLTLSYASETRLATLTARNLSSPSEIKWERELSSAKDGFLIDGHTLYMYAQDEVKAIDLSQNDAPVSGVASPASDNSFEGNKLVYYSPYKGGILASKGAKIYLYNVSEGTVDTYAYKVHAGEEYHTFDDNYIYYVVRMKLYRARPDMTEVTLMHE